MKQISERNKQVVAVTAFFLAAISAAIALRHGNTASADHKPIAAAPVTDGASAPIAAPTGNGATDKEIRKWLQKTAAKNADDRSWVNLGDALMQKARETADVAFYAQAETAYQSALAKNPRSADAMIGMAWVNGGRHAFDESIAWAGRALAIDPNNNLAYGLISDAEVERGEYDAAFDHLQKMLDIRPDLASYSRGAYLLYVTGNSAKARWLMQKAIASGAPYAENTAWCRAQLGLILLSEGSVSDADDYLTDALKRTPANAHVLMALAKVKTARKEYQRAIDLYKKVIRINPQHNALVGLGDLYAVTGHRAAAEKQYQSVIDLHNRNNQTGRAHDHMLMAQFYSDHQRNPIEAVRLAEEHKTSKNVFEADILAWCYYQNGDYTSAKAAVDRALARHTPEARIYYHAGMIALKLGDADAARRYLEQALRTSPNFNPLAIPEAAKTLALLQRKAAASQSVAAASSISGTIKQ